MPADIVGTNVSRENEAGDKFLDFQAGYLREHHPRRDQSGHAENPSAFSRRSGENGNRGKQNTSWSSRL